jgi:hypothetical protein
MIGVAAACLASAAELRAQQGQAGGRGGGGGRGNAQQERYDRSARSIESSLLTYLDGEPVRNILTPGEFSEWTLNIRDGQVVIAEAWSDTFDPAIEVTAQEKILAANDDRFPGDQRPLLLWRFESAGTYFLRVRSFRDKAGGPFFLRFRVYDSVDLSDASIQTEIPADRFLIRLPMKAGAIKRVVIETPDENRFANVSLGQVISPIGLPDIGLASAVRSVMPNTIMAPMDGDYYVVAMGAARPGRRALLRVVARDAAPLKPGPAVAAGKARTNVPALWALTVKPGDTVEVSAPELDSRATFILTEQPELPEFDSAKPETNPFFPQLLNPKEQKGPAFGILPGRARDNRILVFAARRDATLWIASNNAAKTDTDFTLTVRPGAREFTARNTSRGRLTIGRTDYWTFTGDAGDVMSFHAAAEDFAQHIVVRDPDLNEVWSADAALDRSALDWTLVVRKPGRYLIAISCMGDGGSGEYTLSRDVFFPKEFSRASPAEGSLTENAVHVWKFTAKPGEPVLVRWTSSDWSYTIGVQDERGAPASLPLEEVDYLNRFGILAVERPATFIIVLTATGHPARYAIGLTDLPVAKLRE